MGRTAKRAHSAHIARTGTDDGKFRGAADGQHTDAPRPFTKSRKTDSPGSRFPRAVGLRAVDIPKTEREEGGGAGQWWFKRESNDFASRQRQTVTCATCHPPAPSLSDLVLDHHQPTHVTLPSSLLPGLPFVFSSARQARRTDTLWESAPWGVRLVVDGCVRPTCRDVAERLDVFRASTACVAPS